MTFNKTRLQNILRVNTVKDLIKIILVSIIGVIAYIILNNIKLPSYRLLIYLTIQIDPALIIISMAAAFFGPLAGLFVGFFGSLSNDVFLTHHLIAFGLVNLGYGLLGFIIGIPNYREGLGLRNGRILGKLVLFSLIGTIVMILTYLFSLIYIAGQNYLPTLLYNTLPFLSVSIITLLIISPTIIRITDLILSRFHLSSQ